MNILIRKMKQDDIVAVQNIAVESWHATYEGIIPRTIQDSFLEQAYSSSMLQKRCAKTPFYVAELDGQVVGFANFSNKTEDASVELAAIYLASFIQNQGIGSKLLQYGIQTLQPKMVTINVESDNTIGKTFYVAKGFKIIDEFDEDFDGHILKTTRMLLEV